jgi:hypothetical protein
MDAREGVRFDLVGEEDLRDAVEVNQRLRGGVHFMSSFDAGSTDAAYN